MVLFADQGISGAGCVSSTTGFGLEQEKRKRAKIKRICCIFPSFFFFLLL
jgi:hypothetical protein